MLDWAIVAFTLALALWGYRQGLIVGALTLVGFGVGAFAGSRIGPLVLAMLSSRLPTRPSMSVNYSAPLSLIATI